MTDVPKEGYLWKHEDEDAVLLRFLKGRSWKQEEAKTSVLEAMVSN